MKTKLDVLHIRKMDESSPDALTDEDARRAGFADAADFRRWLDTMEDGTVFHRMEVGFDQ